MISVAKVLTLGDIRAVVLPLLERYGLRTAHVFGSYARGEATQSSDIDLLIDGGPSFSPLSVYALGEHVRESTGKDVDVFEVSELDDGPFKQSVLNEAVLL